jgi:hypothetical protein
VPGPILEVVPIGVAENPMRRFLRGTLRMTRDGLVTASLSGDMPKARRPHRMFEASCRA